MLKVGGRAELAMSVARSSAVMSAGSPYAALLKTRMLRAVESLEPTSGMSPLMTCTVAAAKGLPAAIALSCKACNACAK